MVTVDKIKNGIIKYVDSDLFPIMNGAPKILLGTYVAIIVEKLPAIIQNLRTNPAIAILDVIGKDGSVDIDTLYKALAPMMKEEKITLNIPVIGRYNFTKEDIDNLYNYIKE